MVGIEHSQVREAVTSWIVAEPSIVSAVIFGSQSRPSTAAAAADQWSDIDIHIIVRFLQDLEGLDWNKIFPNFHLCLCVSRPATGGVRKLTLVFSEGEVDLIIVTFIKAYCARLALGLGFYPRLNSLKRPLDLFATILHGGFSFVKGEQAWGGFYLEVAKLSGFRLSDSEASILASTALCDLLGVFKKIERGELIAAQRILHISVIEANIILLHEIRSRHRSVSFQQARRVEIIATAREIAYISADTKLNTQELSSAAWSSLNGLKALMIQITPTWTVPSGFQCLLDTYRTPNIARILS